MSDSAMREAGLEPARLATLDPKASAPFQLAREANPRLGSSDTSQSGGAPGGSTTTTDRTTRDRRLEHYLYAQDPLLVLALWQPWAILTVAPDPAHDGEPAKQHETRHWAPRPSTTTLPLNVAIHATKRFDGEVRAALRLPRFKAALERCGYFAGDPHPYSERGLEATLGDCGATLKLLPLGAIVGLARVTVICSTREKNELARADEDDRTFGNWEPGRYAWRLEDTILLPKPVPHFGRQEVLYEVTPTERAAIVAQFE